MSRHKEPPRAATLAAVLARAMPDAHPAGIAKAVGAMIAAAKAHKAWSEADCNGTLWSEANLRRLGLQAWQRPLTDDDRKRAENRLTRLAKAADDALLRAAQNAFWNATTDGQGVVALRAVADRSTVLRTIRLTFGGDPRGACGQLHVSDMPGDGFGPGWAIYE